MRYRDFVVTAGLFVAGLSICHAASGLEKFRNAKVVVIVETLAPGESEALPEKLPSMVVYMADGTVDVTPDQGKAHKDAVKEGQTVYQAAQAGMIRNGGSTPLHFTRIEFLTAGSPETWGMKGLSPNYVMLLEDRYARAYDIKIPAGAFEPQHTHHDRVVVSLSGAELEHILPNGTKQPSTLKTGEVVWRLAATHVGHNMGTTNLWVVAVEPK
jgi:hypothetical protein